MKQGLRAFITVLLFLILSDFITPLARKLVPNHPFECEILLLVFLIFLFYAFIIKVSPLIWKDEKQRMDYLLKSKRKGVVLSGLFFLLFFILFWSASRLGSRIMPAHPSAAEMLLKVILFVCGGIIGYQINKALWKDWKIAHEKVSK